MLNHFNSSNKNLERAERWSQHEKAMIPYILQWSVIQPPPTFYWFPYTICNLKFAKKMEFHFLILVANQVSGGIMVKFPFIKNKSCRQSFICNSPRGDVYLVRDHLVPSDYVFNRTVELRIDKLAQSRDDELLPSLWVNCHRYREIWAARRVQVTN